MSEPSVSGSSSQQPIVIHTDSGRRRWTTRFLVFALVVSLMFNVSLYSSYQQYFSDARGPMERYHSGDRSADSKIAVIEVSGTIMPPLTERVIEMVDKAEKDEGVKGILLVVDSPGGLVADSHEIYHRLTEVRETKPVFVSMKRMAASGGVYVAMGAGADAKIYAEPTTWTGSIGVIIPRYDLRELADKVGFSVEPLKTGKFKDSLSPFRELTEEERLVWESILSDAFNRFVSIVAENRSELDVATVESELATGRIFTAEEAQQNGLIDEIGFENDALEALKQRLQLDKARIVEYRFQPNLMELVSGTVEAKQPQQQWHRLLEATVPRPMYFCSWAPGVPMWH